MERAKARGVDVEITAFKSEELATQAVINGQSDVGPGHAVCRAPESHCADPLFCPAERAAIFPDRGGELQELEGSRRPGDRGAGSRLGHRSDHDTGGQAARVLRLKSISYVPGSQVRALALLKGNIKASILDAPNKNMVMKDAAG